MNKISKNLSYFTYFLFLVAISITLGLSISQSSSAADLSKFKAGRIIDDSVFTDMSSMSPSGIQAFLNSKVPVCDTWGTQPSEFGGGTRAQWGAARGTPAPFICLKDFSENGRSAAQIIYDTAQEFKINPQVFIVLLQKEQGLITDTWPTSTQYRTATGYGCPDSTPGVCNGEYYGFTNQLRWAGRMFRAILNNSPTWYTPYVLGNNYIQYNPTASCGGSNVYIENRSTQALYNYTPYQPNQAALNAGYGTAPCGAYGNRNFFLYFTDWFGSTYAPSYRWEPFDQGAFTDTSTATPVDLNNLTPDTQNRIFLRIKIRNVGSTPWYKHSVNLGTSQPQNNPSRLYDSSWLSSSRPATLFEDRVNPGDIGSFEFWINRPTTPGLTKEYFNLVVENVTWMNDMGLHYSFNTQPITYSWNLVSNELYKDEARQIPANSQAVVQNDKLYGTFKALNTGNTTWKKGIVNIATVSPQNRDSSLHTSSWISPSRPATLSESSVPPGQTGTFNFTLNVGRSGSYKEAFSLVAENIAWMNDPGVGYNMKVDPATYIWEPSSQTAYTDNTRTQLVDLNNLSPGQIAYLEIKVKNNGNTAWNKGIVNIATNGPTNRSSQFYDSRWLSPSRPSTLIESTVQPGEIGTFGFWIKAPQDKGTYKEYFNFVAEYISWFNDLGLHYLLTVR